MLRTKISRPIVSAANHLCFLDAYGFLRRKLSKSPVVILLYHRVGPREDIWPSLSIKPQDFERQIRYLCKAYQVLPLDKLVRYVQRKTLPQKAVVITFDDGYKDNYTYAYPILKKYNVPATIFLTTGHIGHGEPFWWDKVAYLIQNTTLETLELDELGVYPLHSIGDKLEAISRVKEGLKIYSEEKKNLLIEKLVIVSGVDIPVNLGKKLILSWDEVREMKDGGIAFGAHSVTHAILTKLLPEEAKYEIVQSKKDIEDKLGQVITAFSYPNGDFNTELIKFVQESGFTCAVTCIPRMVSPRTSLHELGRIQPDGNFNAFKLFLSRLYWDLKAIYPKLNERRAS